MKKNILAVCAITATLAASTAMAAPGETESVSTGQLNRAEIKMG